MVSPQDTSMNDTHGSGFRTEMNKTTGQFPVRKHMYVSQQRDKEGYGFVGDSGTFLPDRRLYGELNTSSRSGFLIEDSMSKPNSKRIYHKNRINTTARSKIIYPDDLDCFEVKQSILLNKAELQAFKQHKKSKPEGSLNFIEVKQNRFKITDHDSLRSIDHMPNEVSSPVHERLRQISEIPPSHVTNFSESVLPPLSKRTLTNQFNEDLIKGTLK